MTKCEQRLPPSPLLETKRLVLRPLRADDAPVIQRRFPRWNIVRHLSDRVPWPYPSDGAAAHVEKCLTEMARGEKFHWAIVLKGGPGELIGCIDLWPDDGKSRDMRGFWLDPEFQGRGVMTEAADRVTDFAFRDLGWPRLWLGNADANRASARVKEKQGARFVDYELARFVEGEGRRMVWLIDRWTWLERSTRRTDIHYCYWRMCDQWRAIVTQPLADESKTEECLTELRRLMARRAVFRFGQANPSLRFYADMIVLNDCLKFRSASDDFGKLALLPANELVRDWVRKHSEQG
jgi:RimJ/RimL family protein N-acetyltransferase